MDEGTWESGRPPSRVSSHANLSLFDEEILFDDDPNGAYFNYMVGIDNQDDSIVGISTLEEEMRDRNQPSKSVQQRWMNMAESKRPLGYQGPNSIDEGSLFNTIEDGSLPTSISSAVPRHDMQKAIMKRFPGGVKVPNVIFCASGKLGGPGKNNGTELKQEKLTEPGPHHSFLWQNKRKVILGLSLFFLGMVILVVALVSTGKNGGEDTDGTSSSAQGGGGSDASATPSPLSPTSAPHPDAAPAELSFTTAPSAPSTESPTDASAAPTAAPVVSVSSDLIAFLSDLWPDGSSALSDSSSPQFRAAQWLSEEPNFAFYLDRQKIQRYILATLFFATGGDKWTKSDSWLTSKNECNWYSSYNGSCDNYAFQILDLESNNLQGQLPSELALLADTLERLDLRGNNLQGSIPTFFGLLTSLDALSLKNNLNLGGSLPSQLGSLTQLTTLSVGGCSISGKIPTQLGFLTNVDSLGLEMNELVDSIPTQLGLMTNLRNLALNINQLTGTVPRQLFQLQGLEKAALEGNSLTGVIPVAACDNVLTLSADCDKVVCYCCTNC